MKIMNLFIVIASIQLAFAAGDRIAGTLLGAASPKQSKIIDYQPGLIGKLKN
jgi:hypothetical protein